MTLLNWFCRCFPNTIRRCKTSHQQRPQQPLPDQSHTNNEQLVTLRIPFWMHICWNSNVRTYGGETLKYHFWKHRSASFSEGLTWFSVCFCITLSVSGIIAQLSVLQSYPILVGDMDPSGDLNAQIIHQVFKQIRCKFVSQVKIVLFIQNFGNNYGHNT